MRLLFDWLVIGQVIRANPAHSVRGPKHVVKRGKAPVLVTDQARELLESIDTSSVVGLRDRALIGVMTYTFARVGAVVGRTVDVITLDEKREWQRFVELRDIRNATIHFNSVRSKTVFAGGPMDASSLRGWSEVEILVIPAEVGNR